VIRWQSTVQRPCDATAPVVRALRCRYGAYRQAAWWKTSAARELGGHRRIVRDMETPDSGQARVSGAVRVSSTSKQTADIDPIILRETSMTRLIFRPVLLDNPGNPDAPMDGTFIYQRKTQSSEWVDHSDLPLSKLKAEEWVKMHLGAAELLTLFEGLGSYYQLVKEHGLVMGTQDFIPAPKSQALRSLIANEQQFHQALQDEELASALLGGLISWIAGNERAVAAARLDGVSLDELQQFDAVLGLARLQRFCRELEENADNDDEGYWQRTLNSNGWAIAQVYAVPIMLIDQQVYVGGKRITNRSGNTADFLYENSITENVVLVEIKTPATPLLGAKYRNNVINVSTDLTGGQLQIMNARRSLIEHFSELMAEQGSYRRPLSPKGLLIVGSADQLLEQDQRASFEMFRNSQHDIDIVTFDELRQKIELMIELLMNVAQ
jgi:hypothetical protein